MLTASFQGFRFLLAHEFENLNGHAEVDRGQYSLEEACTGKDIDDSIPFTAAVRRGMKINMSIVFVQVADFTTVCCPRCETAYTGQQENVLRQWCVLQGLARLPASTVNTDEN